MIGLTLRQLHYFQALAETQHFGKAARLAGVSQPALSAQIAELEKRLECRLFERGKKAASLTEEGRMILPRVERLLAEARDLEDAARRGRRAMEGRFRLGVIPTVAPYLLPRLLPDLRARFPRLQTELREAVTDALVDETVSGGIDAFIAATPIEAPGLVAEPLFIDRFFLAVPPDEPEPISPPVPPESPVLERLMLLEEGHCLRDQALAVCGQVRPAALARYGATSLTTLLQMVSHGMGITLIPEMALADGEATQNLKVVPFAEPQPSRTICLAWRKSGLRQDECRVLADLIRETRPQAGGALLTQA